MTKKHFIAMARSFKILLTKADGPKARAATIECIKAYMEGAAKANEHFDSGRFLEECGI